MLAFWETLWLWSMCLRQIWVDLSHADGRPRRPPSGSGLTSDKSSAWISPRCSAEAGKRFSTRLVRAVRTEKSRMAHAQTWLESKDLFDYHSLKPSRHASRIFDPLLVTPGIVETYLRFPIGLRRPTGRPTDGFRCKAQSLCNWSAPKSHLPNRAGPPSEEARGMNAAASSCPLTYGLAPALAFHLPGYPPLNTVHERPCGGCI